jgi:hypothetical protein
VPGGIITEHVHPHQEERFIVTSGEAHFTLDGEERVARQGETIIVPPGMRHSEGNPGPGEIHAVVELRPALHSSQWHEALAGLVADGKTTARGAPKNPLQLGATFWYFRRESRVTSPPIKLESAAPRSACAARWAPPAPDPRLVHRRGHAAVPGRRRSVLACRLRPRAAAVSAGSARWGATPAAASSSATYRQPVHPSTANATSPWLANRASQARRCARSAGATWPRCTSPVTVSR